MPPPIEPAERHTVEEPVNRCTECDAGFARTVVYRIGIIGESLDQATVTAIEHAFVTQAFRLAAATGDTVQAAETKELKAMLRQLLAAQ